MQSQGRAPTGLLCEQQVVVVPLTLSITAPVSVCTLWEGTGEIVKCSLVGGKTRDRLGSNINLLISEVLAFESECIKTHHFLKVWLTFEV